MGQLFITTTEIVPLYFDGTVTTIEVQVLAKTCFETTGLLNVLGVT